MENSTTPPQWQPAPRPTVRHLFLHWSSGQLKPVTIIVEAPGSSFRRNHGFEISYGTAADIPRLSYREGSLTHGVGSEGAEMDPETYERFRQARLWAPPDEETKRVYQRIVASAGAAAAPPAEEVPTGLTWFRIIAIILTFVVSGLCLRNSWLMDPWYYLENYRHPANDSEEYEALAKHNYATERKPWRAFEVACADFFTNCAKGLAFALQAVIMLLTRPLSAIPKRFLFLGRQRDRLAFAWQEIYHSRRANGLRQWSQRVPWGTIILVCGVLGLFAPSPESSALRSSKSERVVGGDPLPAWMARERKEVGSNVNLETLWEIELQEARAALVAGEDRRLSDGWG
ncbi:hypothetical protein LTR28_008154, partial [Elasticomyces elasticus]